MLRSLLAVAAFVAVGVAASAVYAVEPEAAKDEVKGKAGGDLPPVFSDVKFADAVAKTKGTDRILIVKFTAEWCGPCKRMDKTTWRDESVVKWVKDNGLAIQVDVDREAKVAQDNGITAMPTMVVFKNGEDFDRVVGYRDAAALVQWLDGVKAGKKSAETPVLRSRGGVEQGGMQERLNKAQAAARDPKTRDDATKEFVWLWNNMLAAEPAMYGVRLSFMAASMKELAFVHPPAREAFTDLRDKAEVRLKGENKTWDDLNDWIVLNSVVRDEDRTLAWFDRIKVDADSGQTLERESHNLEQLLVERKRWSDLPLLYPDPLKKVREAHGFMDMMLKMQTQHGMDGDDEADYGPKPMFRESVSVLYAGLLAAHRDDDAAKVAAEGLKFDDSAKMRVALVRKALEAKEPRASQLELLDQAGKSGEAVDGLKQQVDAGIKGEK